MDRLAPERMFVKVVETGSFASAAVWYGTGSGQASKLVARLEAELGVKLLHRTTRALSLTEAGQAYVERLRALIEEYDDLQTEASNAAVIPHGRIRLTAPMSFGTIRLAPLLARFAAEYPAITLEVQFTDRIVSLVEEGFDAAVRIGTLADTTLTARKLCSARVLVVAARAYLEARGEPLEPGDLTGHDCIIDTNFRDPHLWLFKGAQKATVNGRLSFSDATACLAAAEAGLGIAHAPDFVVAASLAEGRVVALLADYEADPIGVFALYPGGRHLPAKVRAVVDFLARGLKGQTIFLPNRK